MKLPIKKKYFDEIKEGKKFFEVRDAHITFVCEETGEELRKEVVGCKILKKSNHYLTKYFEEGILEDEGIIVFYLGCD